MKIEKHSTKCWVLQVILAVIVVGGSDSRSGAQTRIYGSRSQGKWTYLIFIRMVGSDPKASIFSK